MGIFEEAKFIRNWKEKRTTILRKPNFDFLFSLLFADIVILHMFRKGIKTHLAKTTEIAAYQPLIISTNHASVLVMKI